MWRLKSCVNLLSYLVQLRWQWRIHSTFFPSVSQLASQCQSHHGSCLTIDIDQICPVCDLSRGSNARPVLGLPFPRKVETALFYHKPHLDLPGMRTGTQPVLRKEGVATSCIFDNVTWLCVGKDLCIPSLHTPFTFSKWRWLNLSKQSAGCKNMGSQTWANFEALLWWLWLAAWW